MSLPFVRPNTNNYFQFYGLEEKFEIDTVELRKLYLEKSKEFHPDFYGDNAEAQNTAIAISSYNNLAYKILNNDINRAQYLLDTINNREDNKATLPQSFLMEMMELNESIDEMDETKKPAIRKEIESLKQSTLENIKSAAIVKDWENCRIAVLKWKYLERLELRL